MEAKPETTETKPEPPKPTDNPVMDVVVPPAPEAEEKPQDSPESKTPSPEPAENKEPIPKVDKPQPLPKLQKPTLPKQPRTGSSLAIIATVIIVLGLAAMAVYAFLKTK